MKKLIAICMVILTLASASTALAMEAAFAGTRIPLGEKTNVDLNGDGVQEEILLQMEWPEGWEELVLYVFDPDGNVASSTMYFVRMTGAFAADLDGDGLLELMVSGDLASDDYSTYAYHYNDGQLEQLLFENVERGEVLEEYSDYGYGMVTQISGDQITLTGSQDVLGTWMCSRVFSLQNGQFETVDDGLWRMTDLTDDEDIWEYRSLIPTKAIEVELEDGSAGTLEAGEAFLVTASDKVGIVYFETKDGKKGSFAIAPDEEMGWGSLINGENEDSYFEFIPYAD